MPRRKPDTIHQQGSIAVESAFFFSAMVFLTLVVIDLASVIYAKTELSAAVHAGSAYAMTGYSMREDDIFPALPEISVSQKAATPTTTINMKQEQCYICYDGNDTATCIGKHDVCTGQVIGFMDSITASDKVPLLFRYAGFSNAFPIAQTVYYPGLVNEQPNDNP